jgi:mRNA-degrading endonuclease RelE of RelBE toxin-antitoxin system
MRDLWTLHVAPEVARFLYTLPRGQATELRDILAILRTNPKPEGAQPLVVEELPDVYAVKLGRYRIEYQIIERDRIIRILFVE